MRENERKWELPRQASPKISLIKIKYVPPISISSISSHTDYTNYEINKSKKLLHRDNLGRNKIKKRQKKLKKNCRYIRRQFHSVKIRSSAKFRRGCEILQPLRNWQGFYALSLFLLLVLPSALWFYSSEFQLISSCLSWIPIFNIYSL